MLCHSLMQYYFVYLLIMFPFYKQAKLKQFNYAACSAVAEEQKSRKRKSNNVRNKIHASHQIQAGTIGEL